MTTSSSPSLAAAALAEARTHRHNTRLARMKRAAHFINGRFQNASARLQMDPARTMATLRDFVTNGAVRVPPSALPMVSPLATWRERPRTDLRATWLGHSTVLLELDGARILTDPVWSLRASPTQWLGPRRFHPPPVPLDALPPLDAVLVSHDHYDHLDAEAVAQLARLQSCVFVTSLGVGAHLERFGVPPERIVELDWWESTVVPGTSVEMVAAPAQHFSGRGALDRNRTLWASYAFRGPRHRAFFSGDTGLEPQFGSIAQRLGPFDLVMLEVGAFHPSWGEIHLGPWQAMEAHRALGGGPLLPVHWSTFDLALHSWDEPIRVLAEQAHAGQLPLLAPRLGAPLDVEVLEDVRRRARALDPWWTTVR